MKHRTWIYVLALFTTIFFILNFAFVSTAANTNTGEKVHRQLAVDNWRQDWDKTLAAAKKEGKLVVLNSFGSDGRIAIAKSFKQKYGLDIEFITGRTGEIDAKMTA